LRRYLPSEVFLGRPDQLVTRRSGPEPGSLLAPPGDRKNSLGACR
jgi:hypothetical protein